MDGTRQNDASHNKTTISQREKTMAFFYVLLLFLGTTACCCAFIYLTNDDFNAVRQKEMVIGKMEKIQSFRQVQREQKMTTDSLYRKIEVLRLGIYAQYEEDDIKFILNDLRNLHQNNEWDNRYKVFLQIADFYQMWLTDKKELWGKQQNIVNFKKKLEECEIGLESKKKDLRSDIKKE